MKKIFLYFVVCISGGVVFVLEITGIRLLAPFYGLSLYLWSVLISITLAALSSGYWLGGRWASKRASDETLNLVLAGSGIWIALIPWIKNPLLHIVEPLGLRVAVLVAAFILFFPPFMLLGIINPYSVRLKVTNLEEASRTTGDFFALSTITGVIAVLLTGYILIPNMSVTLIILFSGCLLILTSGIGWLFAGNRKKLAGGSLIVLCIITLILPLPAWDSADPSRGLLAVEQSNYGELRVVDRESGRYLLLDGNIQNITDESGYISDLHSAAVMDLPKYFFSQAGKMLLLGIGNASLVHQYTGDSWKVDAVEINPATIRIANEYYKLKKWNGSVEETDPRRFLATTQESYDVIILNAKSNSLLFHLVTEEAFGLASARLKPNGILAMNMETVGWEDPIISRLGATLKVHFRTVLALPLEEPPDQIGEIVLLASNSELEPLRKPDINLTLDPEWRFGPGYQKVHAWDNRFIPNTKNIPPLTDDLNSIDIRTDIINAAAREKFSSAFSKDNLIW